MLRLQSAHVRGRPRGDAYVRRPDPVAVERPGAHEQRLTGCGSRRPLFLLLSHSGPRSTVDSLFRSSTETLHEGGVKACAA